MLTFSCRCWKRDLQHHRSLEVPEEKGKRYKNMKETKGEKVTKGEKE